MPPLELRELVGATDPNLYRIGPEKNLFPELQPSQYRSVFDFGSGCGRLARILLMQKDRPHRYHGVDLHLGMVKWCTENLSPIDSNFTFEHHDVFNAGLNPHGRSADAVLPLPQESATASLVLACSVFTHLLQRDIPLYLAEMRRIMRPDGVLIASWFLFEKAEFPMMQDFQDCLYINDVDPTNAVMVDKQWLAKTAAAAGLVMSRTVPPSLRGFQWEIEFRPAVDDQQHVSFPSDSAEYGRMPPPVPSTPAFLIGL